jgi:predicted nuclease of predicted toxin-antitoxin system
MHFLVDQDVYKLTVDRLKELGHDVITVKELGMARASDEDLLRVAEDQNRILVTRDKDFFLRVTPGTLSAVHRQLDKTLQEHGQEELMHCFSVIEPGRHRIRHLPI